MSEIDYNKRNIILAPMILLRCTKIDNKILGTTDYVMEDGSLTFRTCKKEKSHLVFQMGTNDPDRALKAAKMIEEHVSAIDVNMGCPKEFSIKGGMGAALLTQPDKVKQILTKLVNNLSIHVTCKIRLLDTIEDTLALVGAIATTGVSAIAVHGRQKHERPRHTCNTSAIAAIADNFPDLPIIANGVSKRVKVHGDLDVMLQECHPAKGLMLARALQWNPSLLRSQGLLEGDAIVSEYLKLCIDYDSVDMNAKYCIQQLMRTRLESEKGRMLAASGSLRQMAEIWNLGEYFAEKMKQRNPSSGETMQSCGGGGVGVKRCSYDDEVACNQIENMQIKLVVIDGKQVRDSPFRYNRRNYGSKSSPKMTLYGESVKDKHAKPEYTFEYNKKVQVYRCMLNYNGDWYRSSIWDKSKKYAEQAVACICLKHLGIHDGSMDQQQITDDIARKVAKYCSTNKVVKVE